MPFWIAAARAVLQGRACRFAVGSLLLFRSELHSVESLSVAKVLRTASFCTSAVTLLIGALSIRRQPIIKSLKKTENILKGLQF